MGCLKVGSLSFEGIIILLIYFLNCRKAPFLQTRQRIFHGFVTNYEYHHKVLLGCLKVGSLSFEGIIILLIYFLNCQKAPFYKRVSAFFYGFVTNYEYHHKVLMGCLKVGSLSFEGIIILLIYFLNLSENTYFYKENKTFNKKHRFEVLDLPFCERFPKYAAHTS